MGGLSKKWNDHNIVKKKTENRGWVACPPITLKT
jgi:hypothetical protein